MLERFDGLVPDGFTVIALADRGLYARWLFAAICKLGWHPLLRVKAGGKFRPTGWGRFYYLGELLGRPGGSFGAEGLAYAGERLACTLLAVLPAWARGDERRSLDRDGEDLALRVRRLPAGAGGQPHREAPAGAPVPAAM